VEIVTDTDDLATNVRFFRTSIRRTSANVTIAAGSDADAA
jgi:hypothetical protein